MKQSIGNFLLRRLKEAGIKHIFGVPGDYNLELMQQLEELGDPAWIGNCNELNASYATDAYAANQRPGALVVTHGVGALARSTASRAPTANMFPSSAFPAPFHCEPFSVVI